MTDQNATTRGEEGKLTAKDTQEFQLVRNATMLLDKITEAAGPDVINEKFFRENIIPLATRMNDAEDLEGFAEIIGNLFSSAQEGGQREELKHAIRKTREKMSQYTPTKGEQSSAQSFRRATDTLLNEIKEVGSLQAQAELLKAAEQTFQRQQTERARKILEKNRSRTQVD